MSDRHDPAAGGPPAPAVKRLPVEVKDADAGTIVARFATYDVVDADGDVTERGAFRDGQEVRISAWNHESWAGALPIGKGVIRDRDDGAVMEGRLFLATAAAREHLEVIKGLGALQEWSYGYRVLDSGDGERDGRAVRILKALDVTEVAPVLKGAGVGTRTLAVKGALANLGVDAPPGVDPEALAAAIATAVKQLATDPDPPPSDEAAEHKRRDTDLLRLVAAIHGIPTGGAS